MAGFSHDHMNALNRYHEYKMFWDRHRIPGESKDKRMLWTDPGYHPVRSRRRLTKSPTRSTTSNKKVRPTSKNNGSLPSPSPAGRLKSAKTQSVKTPSQITKPQSRTPPPPAPPTRKVSFVIQTIAKNDLVTDLQSEEAKTAEYDQNALIHELADLAVKEKKRMSSSSSSSSSDSDSKNK